MAIELLVGMYNLVTLEYSPTGEAIPNIDPEKTAIVNAANSHLQHGGGVAGVISRTAGGTFQADSLALVEQQGPVPVGEARVQTGKYNLPVRHVIHAVGPDYDQGKQLEMEQQLIGAYENSLLVAEELGLETVAFPAISTGIFGFPKALAAKYTRQVIDKFQYDSIQKVIICFVDTGDLATFMESSGYQAKQMIGEPAP